MLTEHPRDVTKGATVIGEPDYDLRICVKVAYVYAVKETGPRVK